MQIYASLLALALMAASVNAAPGFGIADSAAKVVNTVAQNLHVGPKVATGITAGGAGAATLAGIESYQLHSAHKNKKHATLVFQSPSASTKWHCGQSYVIFGQTYGIGTRLPFHRSTLDLKDSEYRQVERIMNKRTKDVIKTTDSSLFFGPYGHGVFKYKWTIPEDFESGSYKLEYNLKNKYLSKTQLQFTSDSFEIICDPKPDAPVGDDDVDADDFPFDVNVDPDLEGAETAKFNNDEKDKLESL